MDGRIAFCVLILQLSVAVLGYTRVVYIDNKCGQIITVQDSVRIKLRSYSWPSPKSCSVTLSGTSPYHLISNTRILLRFLNINLSTGPFSACSKSRVDIIDSNGVSILSDSSGTCGYSTLFLQSWKSTSNTITIRLKRLSSFTQSGSFEILATQFSSGFCDYREFDCFNGRCIDSDLNCDGYDNCGDDSDETDGCYWAPGVTAGVAVASIFGFAFFVIILGAVYRRRTYGRILWTRRVPYSRDLNVTQATTTVTSAGVVASSQFGVQATVPGGVAPPPPYPGSPYPAAGPKY